MASSVVRVVKSMPYRSVSCLVGQPLAWMSSWNPSEIIKKAKGMSFQIAAIPEAIKPIAWLLGKWKAEAGGQVIYPTMKPVEYAEEVEFFTCGQPNIEYRFYSSTASEPKKLLHREVGFIRLEPETKKLAFMSAHNFGVADIQEGKLLSDNKLEVKTHGIIRMSFAKLPETKKLVRMLERKGDKLEHVLFMETSNTKMTEHLRVTYNKVS